VSYMLQQSLALLMAILTGAPLGWLLRRERERNTWI